MRKLFAAFGTLAMLSAAPNAFALCTGTIQGVAIQATSGDVLLERINLTTGEYIWYPRFCSVTVTANGIPPDGCKAVYAALMSAQAQQKSVTFYAGGSCTSHQQWQYMSGFYFLMVNG